MTPRALRTLAAVSTVVTVGLVGVAHASTPPTPAASAPASAPTADVAVELMRRAPAALLAEGATLAYVDLAAAFEEAGMADGTAQQRVEALVGPLLRAGLNVPMLFGDDQLDVPGALADVGFSIVDIAQELAVGSPPHTAMLDAVNVPPGAIDTAVHADPVWSARLTASVDHGVTVYDWGEQLDITARTPLHSLGRGGQLAVEPNGAGSMVARTFQATSMAAVRATAAEQSVAQRGPFVDAIRRLPSGRLLQAFGVVAPSTGRRMPMPINATLPDAGPTSSAAPPVSVLAAESVDHATRLLVTYADDATAAAAVATWQAWFDSGTSHVSRQPIASLFAGATITSDGPVVIVDVTGERAFTRLDQMVLAADLPG